MTCLKGIEYKKIGQIFIGTRAKVSPGGDVEDFWGTVVAIFDCHNYYEAGLLTDGWNAKEAKSFVSCVKMSKIVAIERVDGLARNITKVAQDFLSGKIEPRAYTIPKSKKMTQTPRKQTSGKTESSAARKHTRSRKSKVTPGSHGSKRRSKRLNPGGRDEKKSNKNHRKVAEEDDDENAMWGNGEDQDIDGEGGKDGKTLEDAENDARDSGEELEQGSGPLRDLAAEIEEEHKADKSFPDKNNGVEKEEKTKVRDEIAVP